MATKILYAEDEERMRRLVRDFLSREGFSLIEVSNGEEALEAFKADDEIALVILDVMMPKRDGWETCKELRKLDHNVPIMMLTAKGEEYDELYGFGIGVDDYIHKPFSPLLLIARIKALLNRSMKKQAINQQEVWEKGGIRVEFFSNKVFIKGEMTELSPKEFAMLECFIENEGRVLTREYLLNRVWGFDYFGDTRTVDTHMNRLRMKLGAMENCIQTIRGKGYRFEVVEDKVY
ncbi:MAG TPA: response regulator transcription factor [Firmicutes bacterium]|nr:response regulator transcription factor [Bacillales bacterium]HJA40667.1 response regulator transcription factor [Bacillota bacterium]